MADVATGRINRRQTLSLGLKLGIAMPVLNALWQAAPSVSAASLPTPAHERSSFAL